MANPLISQGRLNLLRASVLFAFNPGLNVTAPFVTKGGIKMTIRGEITGQIPTMTGVANSQQPYVMVDIEMNLLKTQSFSDAWKTQIELDSQLGSVTIVPDSETLSPYQIENASITSMHGLDFNGTTPDFTIVVSGVYNINDVLWLDA
jgi:hypothetical protein